MDSVPSSCPASLLLCLLLITSFVSQAQSLSSFPLASDALYWKNKKPDAAYWQQDVAYQIKASLDERTHIIDGDETLTYYNNSPDTLAVVYFHLYENAFTKGSYLEALHKANKQPIRKMGPYARAGLGTEVLQLSVNTNGKEEVLHTELDNTVLKVVLPQTLKPNQAVQFHLHFKTYFEQGDFRRRMAMYPSWGFMHFNGVHWYPRICVYDRKKGWDTDQHLNKEFYGDYGLFDVELTMASNYVVEATGVLQNPTEVYPGDLRERLDIKHFANKPWNEAPSIITPYDPARRKTWHFKASHVHDFAFTADPHYRIAETSWHGVQCIGLALEPHAAGWQHAGELVAKTIQTFSEDFGMYEYPKMVAADANDGMEYPMLTLDGGSEPDYHSVIVHEVGHNWFYGMIGNNETYRAALDEGFTQFLTAWGLRKIDGDTFVHVPERLHYKQRHRDPELYIDRSVYNRYMTDAVRHTDKPLNTHSDDFHGALGHENGYSNVYHKTATMLYNLQEVLGDSLFQHAMQYYVASWKMAHPYFEDFRRSIIAYTHQDLNCFFDEWMETTKYIDYGIQRIQKIHGSDSSVYRIRFRRYGSMQMPFDFSVTDKTGAIYDYHIPNTNWIKSTTATVLPKWFGWDILNPTYTADVHLAHPIHRVELDPTHRLADTDPLDNDKVRGLLLSPHTLHLKLERFIQDANDWKKDQAYWRPDVWWNPIDGLKAGLLWESAYLHVLRNLQMGVWLNTRLLSAMQYRPYEGQGWWSNAPLLDYKVRYETVWPGLSGKLRWGVSSRLQDAAAQHRVYSLLNLSDHSLLSGEAVSLYRIGGYTHDYLFYPEEWNSYSDGRARNTKKNTFIQLGWKNEYRVANGNGFIQLRLRAPINYDYSFIQGEWVHHSSGHKLALRTRLFARFGHGQNIPTESALYLQGGNPEAMMDNKFTRTAGVLPAELGGYSSDHFSHLQAEGGLNLRGYTGYYALDQNAKGTYINYKGRSGASFNTELDFGSLLPFHPKHIREYLHLDPYLFFDAGSISRGWLNDDHIQTLTPLNSWSKLRTDAGLGLALTLKKFGPLEKVKPFVIRFDMPFFISATPYNSNRNFDWRWVLGLQRCF